MVYFLQKKLCILDKKSIGLHFGRFFPKIIWSPCFCLLQWRYIAVSLGLQWQWQMHLFY
jgi:hypothetical protein